MSAHRTSSCSRLTYGHRAAGPPNHQTMEPPARRTTGPPNQPAARTNKYLRRPGPSNILRRQNQTHEFTPSVLPRCPCAPARVMPPTAVPRPPADRAADAADASPDAPADAADAKMRAWAPWVRPRASRIHPRTLPMRSRTPRLRPRTPRMRPPRMRPRARRARRCGGCGRGRHGRARGRRAVRGQAQTTIRNVARDSAAEPRTTLQHALVVTTCLVTGPWSSGIGGSRGGGWGGGLSGREACRAFRPFAGRPLGSNGALQGPDVATLRCKARA